jgi:hypothetical protein
MNRTIDEQVAFFDYIYPRMSMRLDELEKFNRSNESRLIEIQEERKHLLLEVSQYKKKIQRIEQFLIEKGLINLLGKKEDS